MSSLRVAGLVKESIVDGPGIRYAVFTQGCSHDCRNCHNPETHDFQGGEELSLDSIVEDILKNPLLDGLTLTGGDPLYQLEASLELLKMVKDLSLTTVVYTGFTFEEISLSPARKIFPYVDLLIDGRFVEDLKTLNMPFIGSSNQRIIDVKESLRKNSLVEYEEGGA